MLKKSLFVPDTLEKLFKNSSSMWKYDSCHAAKVSQTSGYPESECQLYNLNLARADKIDKMHLFWGINTFDRRGQL